jgi:hypothetical protein
MTIPNMDGDAASEDIAFAQCEGDLYDAAVAAAADAMAHDGKHLSAMSRLAGIIAQLYEVHGGASKVGGFWSWCVFKKGMKQPPPQTKYREFAVIVNHLLKPKIQADRERCSRFCGALQEWADRNSLGASGPGYRAKYPHVPGGQAGEWFEANGHYSGVYRHLRKPRLATLAGNSPSKGSAPAKQTSQPLEGGNVPAKARSSRHGAAQKTGNQYTAPPPPAPASPANTQHRQS